MSAQRLLLIALAIALPLASGRATTLTYDTPSLQITAGQSITVGATLTLDPGDVALVTDGFGFPIVVYQQQFLDGMFFGTPDYFFEQNTNFTAASDPLANLNVQPGGSVDLVLGTIATLASLPTGSYATDIGINDICIGTCFVSPFFAPSYADAGLLAITVTQAVDSVPEPATLPLLLGALPTLTLLRRHRLNAAAI
jgi:hypothetical protein